MDHREGADKTGDVRLDFDRRVRLEFHGSKISSNGGLLLFRELDEVLGLHDIAGGLLRDTRTGHNRLHSLVGLLRRSVFGRLAGYDDVNDADRLSLDPVMRQVVGGRAVDAKAASSSQMGRFETEVLATSVCFMAGLSPRARGNLVRFRSHFHSCGSIPACAGEPILRPLMNTLWRVYPRVRGGT